jgi:hypothetical protein
VAAGAQWSSAGGVFRGEAPTSEEVLPVDVKKLESLPGMPSGFPFAMVLVGIGLAVLGALFAAIGGGFMMTFGMGIGSIGASLVLGGSLLQSVLWVVSGFGHRPPPSAGA